MFRKISLINGLNVRPIILDSEFFELSFILVVPGAESSFLFLGECASAGKVALSPIAHLDVLADVVLVGDLGVALDHCELLLVLAGGD
jgi:hypothetical protein